MITRNQTKIKNVLNLAAVAMAILVLTTNSANAVVKSAEKGARESAG